MVILENIDIDMVIFENIDIDKAILENIDIDIDKAILENIDIDKDNPENIDCRYIGIFRNIDEISTPFVKILISTKNR